MSNEEKGPMSNEGEDLKKNLDQGAVESDQVEVKTDTMSSSVENSADDVEGPKDATHEVEQKAEVKTNEVVDKIETTSNDQQKTDIIENVETPSDESEKAADIKDEAVAPTSEVESAIAQTDVSNDAAVPSDEQPEIAEAEEESEEEPHLDYSNYSKQQLVQVLESLSKDNEVKGINNVLKEIRPAFDHLFSSEKKAAYAKYLEDGGEKDGFDYKEDELDKRFNKAYETLRSRVSEHYNSIEKQKENNLLRKQEVLERLRSLVDAEETQAGLKEIKQIQEDWKQTGPVAPQHSKSLWANYNALIDRYYDNRSIYFELKELDRKKNLELKGELCDKAESLANTENIKEAIKQLNELHEEYKAIGPVPIDEQENLWNRFKAASDAIYEKRKAYFDELKKELQENLKAKEELAEKAQAFFTFESERISDWNGKTKEILELQKEWDKIGGLPRDKAKDVNKNFWGAFKGFFHNKGLFFKKIEEMRKENLAKKQELVKRAEALKENEDFNKTAEELKALQREWKEIGPVPEKFRNSIYEEFKAACDHFFNKKRAASHVDEKEFTENLSAKQAICKTIDDAVKSGEIDLDFLEDRIEEYSEIGFVPKSSIKSIQKELNVVVDKALDAIEASEEDRNHIRYAIQFSKLKHGPNAKKVMQKKENALRKQIAKLENDISLWKNNLDFFAASKTADKLKEEFEGKIEEASKKLSDMEEKLRTLNEME